MIGGYIHRERDDDLDARLRGRLRGSSTSIAAWDLGFLFHDEPFAGKPTSVLASDDVIVVAQDLLATSGPDGEYRSLDLSTDLAPRIASEPSEAFDAVAGDCRMVAIHRRREDAALFLVSHRAGSGRMYYRALDSGVVFCSDLRFLLSVLPWDVSLLGVYSILKYGAVPEPMTVAESVEAVPPSHYLRYDVRRGHRSHEAYFKLRFEYQDDDGRTGDESVYLPAVESALRKSCRFLAPQRPAILLSGGIDSSLYGCYLGESADPPPRGLYCRFGDDDPELEFANRIAARTGSDLLVARMETPDAVKALEDVTRWTDHPFSDFSSLPIAFLLDSARKELEGGTVVIECNGGDDCFGFPDLTTGGKYAAKHRIPKAVKRALAPVLRRTGAWKWESDGGVLARACAAVDAHERSALDYFLVLTPVGHLGLEVPRDWDETLRDALERGFVAGGEDYHELGRCARTTIRQLLQVNSRRWAAKALSVGESLGLPVVYPYIWRDVLRVQGQVPWSAKVRDGVVKWPLKRLLERYMPESFIYRKKSGFVPPFARWLQVEEFHRPVRDVLLDRDAVVTRIAPRRTIETLLSGALRGKTLRHSILNFLWGALFTEMWIRRHRR